MLLRCSLGASELWLMGSLHFGVPLAHTSLSLSGHVVLSDAAYRLSDGAYRQLISLSFNNDLLLNLKTLSRCVEAVHELPIQH